MNPFKFFSIAAALAAFGCGAAEEPMNTAGASSGGTGGGSVNTAGSGGSVNTAGTNGVAGMDTGGTGGTGAGGAPVVGPPSCDVMTALFQKMPQDEKSCDLDYACHGDGVAASNGASFLGTQSEIIARLKDMPSSSGNCLGMYINSAAPAESMLLKKTSADYQAACPTLTSGSQMPLGVNPLTPAEHTCLTEWVYGVANGTIQ